jgi:hypothetical protein
MKKAIAIVLVLVGFTGCSKFNNKRGVGDAAVGTQDRTPPKVIVFSDRFANVEFKCNGSTGIYVTTRNAAPVVVANDDQCPRGGG